MKNTRWLLSLVIMVSALPAWSARWRVSAEGSGGTTNGDREAACGRAADRALDGVYAQCSGRYERLLETWLDSCRCARKPKTRDDYVCRQWAHGTCQSY